MKAIWQGRYGGPETLELREVDAPTLRGPRDVLVRVRAASVNAGDWHMMLGQPRVLRLATGLTAPRPSIRGMDLAGVVETVGAEVTRFAPGDAVFGTGTLGTFCELALVPEDRLARKPERASFDEAGTLGVAALTALQGVRDHAKLEPGGHVLVYGAGGGVGTFTVQIAKALGARVTAVTNADAAGLARELGADDVIDYAAEDPLARPTRYDALFDLAGNRTFAECRNVLTPGGKVVSTGAGTRRGMGLLARPLAGALTPRVAVFVSGSDTADLETLGGLVDAGKLKPVIERTYPLPEAAEAMRRMGTGKARGKLVLRVG